MRRLFVAIVALCLIATGASAFWQSRLQVGVVATSSITVTATDSATDLTTQTNETYASKSFSIGAADLSRKVVVCFSSRNSGGTPTATTVKFVSGTITATKVDNVVNGTAAGAELWFAALPVGTTTDISIVFSGANSRSAIQVYSIIGSTVDPGAGNHGNSVANTPTATITIPSGGAAIGCEFSTAGYPSTITGAPSGFNNVDQNNNLTGTQGFASLHTSGLTGSQTLTINSSPAISNSAGVFGAWGQ